MPDGVYNGLKYVSWECFQCGIPNISTSIFDTTIFEVSNSFSQLSSNEHLSPESDISFSFPNATSSPSRPGAQQDTAKRKDLPLRVVTLNCQSIKTGGKPAQLQNMISSLQGDIVIGSESWLNSSIKSQEVFPEGFNSYRRDRPAGSGGGVFILVSKQFHSSQPEELIIEENTDCELLWVKVKVKGSSDLYIGSFYRPPDKTGAGQNIPGQNIPCHFFTPRTKHPTKICHPGQNIPRCFCHPGHNIPCHFCHPGHNIPCHFCHPGQNIPYSDCFFRVSLICDLHLL